jgi:hypothetical protein
MVDRFDDEAKRTAETFVYQGEKLLTSLEYEYYKSRERDDLVLENLKTDIEMEIKKYPYEIYPISHLPLTVVDDYEKGLSESLEKLQAELAKLNKEKIRKFVSVQFDAGRGGRGGRARGQTHVIVRAHQLVDDDSDGTSDHNSDSFNPDLEISDSVNGKPHQGSSKPVRGGSNSDRTGSSQPARGCSSSGRSGSSSGRECT